MSKCKTKVSVIDQELNKKCKTLLDNVSLLLQQQGNIAQSDSLHSRLSNTFFPTESCNSDFTIEDNSVSNDACENSVINENALTLSPCLRKLPKFSHKSNETTLNTTPTSSSDCRTPPYVPKWNAARFSAMKSTGKSNSLDNYNPNCDDTPKIESIGLSKRSFEFFKSLISPKSSKNDSENVSNLSEDSSYNASLEKAPSSLYNKHFSSFATGRVSLNGTPTTPLAKKNENNDLQNDSAYVLEEQDSIYADADNETESDLEMKFPMNF